MSLFLLSLCLTQTSCYLTTQGYYQGKTLLSAKPLIEAKEDSRLSPEILSGLDQVDDVLQFARSHGLKVGDSYQQYIHTGKPYVSYLVQAAYPDRLESVRWWFPIVGSVPYLGFFHKEDRDDLETDLREKGYDIHLGYAAAFSGLGYFDDPIFTSMVTRKRYQMAHLFFHELTHKTIWLPGSVKFNENLAEFVGEELTELYLKDSPDELKIYQQRRADNTIYRAWLARLRKELKQMYASKELNRAAKLERKNVIFKKYQTTEFPSFSSRRFEWAKKRKWNNASILASSLYSPDTSKFRRAFNCVDGRSMKAFLARLQSVVDRGKKGEKILKAICE